MTLKVVVSMMLLSLVAAISAQNWCEIQSCRDYNKGIHTLCAYNSEQPSRNCLANGNLGGGLSLADKSKIVHLHNALRQKVARGDEARGSNGPQPRAKFGIMPNLQWDDTLAKIAQRWADQCHFGHDQCRDVPAYQVGQNVAISWTSDADLSKLDVLDMVRNWYEEVQYFDQREVSRFSGNLKAANGKLVGHYTQMVWAETTKIGCGLRNYYFNNYYFIYLVCNYGPSGNFLGQAIY